ncbi:MAG: Methylmalonyl-CoA mutase [Calditrichaeota bacterium]|nr:Methylmalonyl-CoA mutase [Calditrichota bacterium]
MDRGETTQPFQLRDDFPPPALEQWHDQVMRALGGTSFEAAMQTATREGITLRGLYTRADLDGLDALDSLPGDLPLLRGARPLGNRDGWQISQALPYPTYDEFNEALVLALARGQTAVNLILDEATQAGLDPDQAEVGRVGKNGTSISSVIGLGKALDGVDLEATPLHVEAGSAALPFAALVVALMRRRGNDVAKWSGSAGMDPLAGLVTHGSLPISLEWAYDELAILTRWALENAPELHTISVYGHPYRDAGADAASELAAAIATAVEALRRMEERGIRVELAAPRVLFGFTTGPDFFVEIAKLRAARRMWARVVQASGGTEKAARRMFIHTRTSTHRTSALDPHANILRAATEAFAAVIGGTNSLHVVPFDAPLSQAPGELARRIARNTQVILSEEAHANNVIDPAGGSYFIERLTDELAGIAWAKFQQIEARGGMLAALREGSLQEQIAQQAQRARGELGTRADVLVGVNRYPNADEEPRLPSPPDFECVHAARAKRLQQLRTSSSHQQEVKVLETLQRIVESDADLKFEAVIEAAEHGATIGEFASSLRYDRQQSNSITPLASARAAEPFERLRARVHAWQVQRAPAVFLANVGPFADYMPRLDFARSFYEVGGFRVAADDWFGTAADAARAAADSGAAVVVIVARDETYREAAPAIAGAVNDEAVVHIAGRPRDDVTREAFRAAGVSEFIHAGSDVLAVLNELADELGA